MILVAAYIQRQVVSAHKLPRERAGQRVVREVKFSERGQLREAGGNGSLQMIAAEVQLLELPQLV